MKILRPNKDFVQGNIELTSSKSESNRALIIQALCTGNIKIKNLSDSDDTQTLLQLLKSYKNEKYLDVHHAGTTFRFLTAFLATQKGKWTLTGSERMQERPIKILVDTLNKAGADIKHLNNMGFPPIDINGSNINLSSAVIDGSISSQYISALLLIAPTLNQKTKITFANKVMSRPYLNMTMEIMKHFGAKIKSQNNSVSIENSGYTENTLSIESDWSAASYWYEIVALSKQATVEIHGLKKKSFQGDSKIADYYLSFGVTTTYGEDFITIKKEKEPQLSIIKFDLNETPDLAQTIICTSAGLGIESHITGLETLKIKETDRLEALKKELLKFDVQLELIENHSAYLKGGQKLKSPSKSIKTYNDHRMAMAFAPLALITGSIDIENPEVVSKSYPNYWNDLESVGFKYQD